MRKHHHIERADQSRYWIVVVKRSPGRLRRYFHDGRYGSKAAALAEAIAYRDQLLATIPRWRIHRRSSRNKSGTIGVFLVEQRHGSRVDQRWTVTWKEDGHHRQRAFSVKHYGSRRAKALAVALRQEKLAAAQFEPPSLERIPLSNTGVLGVCRRIIAGVPVYVAVWREHGKQRMRGFSTSRYGETRARTLAIKTRHKMHKP